MPEVPLCLERQPDLSIPARERFEQERGVGADAPAALDDGVEPLEGNIHPIGRFDLGHPERFKKLFQEHLARMRWRAMGRKHFHSSVIFGAPDAKHIGALETTRIDWPFTRTAWQPLSLRAKTCNRFAAGTFRSTSLGTASLSAIRRTTGQISLTYASSLVLTPFQMPRVFSSVQRPDHQLEL